MTDDLLPKRMTAWADAWQKQLNDHFKPTDGALTIARDYIGRQWVGQFCRGDYDFSLQIGRSPVVSLIDRTFHIAFVEHEKTTG